MLGLKIIVDYISDSNLSGLSQYCFGLFIFVDKTNKITKRTWILRYLWVPPYGRGVFHSVGEHGSCIFSTTRVTFAPDQKFPYSEANPETFFSFFDVAVIKVFGLSTSPDFFAFLCFNGAMNPEKR